MSAKSGTLKGVLQKVAEDKHSHTCFQMRNARPWAISLWLSASERLASKVSQKDCDVQRQPRLSTNNTILKEGDQLRQGAAHRVETSLEDTDPFRFDQPGDGLQWVAQMVTMGFVSWVASQQLGRPPIDQLIMWVQ
jgi:hypothetical protein